jgi:hypothetical protein
VANWRIWTLPQMVNILYVPAQYRVLFANCVALIWNMYLARSNSRQVIFVLGNSSRYLK